MSNGSGVVRFIRDTARCSAEAPPDAVLLNRFATSADEEAFRLLVARHSPLVWGICRRLTRNHHDAEDAFQATFLIFARGARGIRSGSAVGGWLCGVAGRVASRVCSARRPAAAFLEPADGHPDGALGELTIREAEAILYEELARLPEKYRDAVVLCCLEGLARDEAASRLGWSENQVKNCLEQGRERLRSRLARRGIALGVPLLTSVLTQPAAAVPARTIEKIHGFTAGANASAAVSSLADRVTRTMWIAKWKWAAVTFTALILTAGGSVAALVHQTQKDARATPPPRAAINPAPEGGGNKRPPVAEQKDEAAPSWDVAVKFLKLAIDQKTDEALKLCVPGTVSAKKIGEIKEAGYTSTKVAAVLINDTRIEVVFSETREEKEVPLHLVIMLTKSKDGTWQVKDIDNRNSDQVEDRVKLYLEGRYNKPAEKK